MSAPVFDDPFFDDVCWVEANEKRSHVITVRSTNKPPIQRMAFSLGAAQVSRSIIRQIFYGSAWRDPSEFTGLSEFYSTPDREKAQNAVNVMDAGGRGGNLASFYVVVWSPHFAYLAHNVSYEGILQVGLVLADWRFVIRVANIDIEAEYPVDVAALISQSLIQLPVSSLSRDGVKDDT